MAEDTILNENTTINVFQVRTEKATIGKPGKERHGESGDKVYANNNGSGVLIDGMGGYGGDNIAARVSGYDLNRQLEILPLNSTINETHKAMRQGFIDAGNAIRKRRSQDPTLAEMDAVGDAIKICFSPDQRRKFLTVGHVGDTSTFIYRASSEKLEKVTTDHTLVQSLVDANIISADSAFLHPQRNVVTRNIGSINENNVDQKLQIAVKELYPGDFAISFSDGITDNVPQDEIERIISNSPQAIDRLKAGSWQSGFTMHLAEAAHGIAVENARPQAKLDDNSALLLYLASQNLPS